MPSHQERVRRNYPEGVPQFGCVRGGGRGVEWSACHCVRETVGSWTDLPLDRAVPYWGNDAFNTSKTCPECHGSGKVSFAGVMAQRGVVNVGLAREGDMSRCCNAIVPRDGAYLSCSACGIFWRRT